MHKFEEATKTRGGHVAALNTYSFQTPGFYENLGYEAFGTIDGYGHGHHKHFFRKDLR